MWFLSTCLCCSTKRCDYRGDLASHWETWGWLQKQKAQSPAVQLSPPNYIKMQCLSGFPVYLLDVIGLLPPVQIAHKKYITAFCTVNIPPGNAGGFCHRWVCFTVPRRISSLQLLWAWSIPLLVQRSYKNLHCIPQGVLISAPSIKKTFQCRYGNFGACH